MVEIFLLFVPFQKHSTFDLETQTQEEKEERV